MPRHVLDTNILIDHFRLLRPYARKSPAAATDWAAKLIANKETDAIVSPVLVEFLYGVVDAHEMQLAEAYIGSFRIIDGHETLAQDWLETRRSAKHVGHQAVPRHLGDCLISAIASRLKYEVITKDRGLLRQWGRTRQRRQ
jgi:predicted nucleic acid-binding protein